jgi:hypothetical protein
MSHWYFNPVGGYWLASAIAIVLLVLTLAGLPKRRITMSRRRVLVGLRLAVIALAMFAVMRPALVHSIARQQSATLVLLLDRSRSMMVGDGLGGKSRWKLLQSAVEDALPTLDRMRDDLEISVYAFDSELHPIDFSQGKLDLEGSAEGTQTAIGAALEDVLRRESGKRLAGVVLASDGAQRAYAPRDIPPQGPARRLADLGYPLYTLPFGQGRGLAQTRDLALSDLSVNQTVYVKNELTVHASARADGFGGRGLPVQLLFETSPSKMEPVGGEEIKAPQNGQAVPIELSMIPQTPGEYKLTLRVEPQPGELVTTNNELSTFVTVLKGGVNVLYLEGALRADQKFLRRSLDASPDIKVDYQRLVGPDGQHHSIDLKERLKPGKYDVYMLGDVDASMFTSDELAALASAVKAGAGLIMLGGFHTFGPGGYQDTPLAGLLPVAMDPRERQRLGDPIRDDVQLPGPVRIRPAKPLGARHYLMALAPGVEGQQLWDKLPPLEGANKLGAPKPGAQVLAETPEGNPLLVVQDAGGRVIAFAGDTTWHWWMEGFEREHKRFWRQVVLWLAHKDETADSNLWIKLDKRRFGPREPVAFTVGAQSGTGDPLDNVSCQAEVTSPDGSKHKLTLVHQGDHFAGTFDQTQTSGDYSISVAATRQGAPLGSARSRFLVYHQDLELDNAAADPALLASLSAMTKDAGGQSLAPEELPTLLKNIHEKPLESQVETIVKHTPWDTWPFFLIFIGLISTEWYLRKKWGLA